MVFEKPLPKYPGCVSSSFARKTAVGSYNLYTITRLTLINKVIISHNIN